MSPELKKWCHVTSFFRFPTNFHGQSKSNKSLPRDPRIARSAELEIFITDLVQIKLSLIFSELEFAYAQYIIELIFIDPFFIRKSRIQDTFEGTN